MMMEEQLDRTREEIRDMDKVKGDIEGALEQLKAEGIDADAALQSMENDKGTASTEQSTKENSLVWDLMGE